MSQSNSKSFNTAAVSSTSPNRQSNITCNNDDTDYSYSTEMLIGRTVRAPLGKLLNQVQESLLLLRNLTHETSSGGTSSGTSDAGNEAPTSSLTWKDHGHNILKLLHLTDQDPTVDEENKDDDGAQGENHDQEDGSDLQKQRWTALATEVHHCMILEDIMEELGNTGRKC